MKMDKSKSLERNDQIVLLYFDAVSIDYVYTGIQVVQTQVSTKQFP